MKKKNVKRAGRAPIRSNSRRLTENLPTLENLFNVVCTNRMYVCMYKTGLGSLLLCTFIYVYVGISFKKQKKEGDVFLSFLYSFLVRLFFTWTITIKFDRKWISFYKTTVNNKYT